jgi:hypothetical protein
VNAKPAAHLLATLLALGTATVGGCGPAFDTEKKARVLDSTA